MLLFRADLEKFNMIKPINLKKKKEKLHDIVSDLYNYKFEKYYDDNKELFDAKHKPRIFRLKHYKNKSFFR